MGHRKLLTKGYIIMAHLYGATGTEGANPLPPVSIYIYIYIRIPMKIVCLCIVINYIAS